MDDGIDITVRGEVVSLGVAGVCLARHLSLSMFHHFEAGAFSRQDLLACRSNEATEHHGIRSQPSTPTQTKPSQVAPGQP